ncbi:hypothetical protein BKA60DRAFT_543719 [Fusarium oxysporum]|nr:hypothetical protein BKA60DRAFT_543719 [Fusarium oxysporum]
MPKPSETGVFTRTGNTAGNQEKVEKLASQWKGKGIEITVGPKRITFITPPGLQSRVSRMLLLCGSALEIPDAYFIIYTFKLIISILQRLGGGNQFEGWRHT